MNEAYVVVDVNVNVNEDMESEWKTDVVFIVNANIFDSNFSC